AAIRQESGERVRVEVLNAAGTAGLARAATRLLRERSFDVVYFGNAGGFGRDTSWVIDRAGRMEDAQRVADALRIPRVRSAPDATLFLEVTVVLGADWEGAAHARGLEPYRATAGAP
ncbi:MAG TPA: LytR C-terminal domain-containing protein, partial [Longimicrobiaceae bacterium]|nr:LytR C-terminal domain-containing protein [Longimicrobiaceae bacterium]